MDDLESPPLSIKIVAIIVVFLFCIYLVDAFVIDSVPEVYNNKGNLIAKIGMTKNEIISNMGEPPLKDDDLESISCFCYPVSFQDNIKTSFWRNNMFFNYLKIIFEDRRVEEIYFFGYNLKGALCNFTPPLAIKINKEPYK